MSHLGYIHIKSFEAKFTDTATSAAASTHNRPISVSPHHLTLTDLSGRLELHLEAFDNVAREAIQRAATKGTLHLLVGDYTEVTSPSDAGPYANAVPVEIDLRAGMVRSTSSMVGLPPIFITQRQGYQTVSCPFFPPSQATTTDINLESVADILRWGHPIDGRTLFTDTQIAAAESVITLRNDGSLHVTEALPSQPDPLLEKLSQVEIIEQQMLALDQSARRMSVASSFVSLSGGLDSRTAVVALLNQGHSISCVTLAASEASLDARLARQFCNAHGLPLHTVNLDDSYLRALPQLVLESAALTGGTSCLSQTIDLYLYKQLKDQHRIRVSGNLGNQVGRGGLESLSAAQPDISSLSQEVVTALAKRQIEPWFIARMAGGKFGEVLFRQEIPYWSVANYCTGSSQMLQLTPYADRQLIALSRALYARDSELQNPQRDVMRRRDIRHRLAGTPTYRSFQRRYLIERDAKGSKIPLNWGWLAGGGWSPKWCMVTVAGAADAGLLKLAGKSRHLAPGLRWASGKLGRPSALVGWPAVLKQQLRELTYDVMQSHAVRTSGVFDTAALTRLLDRHYSAVEDNYSTIYRLLEIGLGIYTSNATATTHQLT